MIEFRQVSPYGLVSVCERWRLGKYIIANAPVYRLWDGFECTGTYPSAVDAKQACLDRIKAVAILGEAVDMFKKKLSNS